MREVGKGPAWFLSISRPSTLKLALCHGEQGYIGSRYDPTHFCDLVRRRDKAGGLA